ncbi:MAG TPA: hypothetical protein DCO77_07110 [Nitrospiraceae bacterium]|nr:hypothetical protein [Nitrospiraceae bacterium]
MKSAGIRYTMLIIVFLLISAFVLTPSTAVSENLDTLPAERLQTVVTGGLLYDKWWKELGIAKPASIHPSYPEIGKKRGTSTWRCKECHGWDYKGSKGAYGRGGHYTGIRGIRVAAGTPEKRVTAILRNKSHQFDRLPQRALQAIAAFVVYGQVDMDKYIDRASKKAKGDKASGGRLFQTICARCHGADGTLLNFSGDPKNPEYIGTVATRNPWETLHKIRYGQPGEQMPSMLALSLEQQLAILAYTQTLPLRRHQ